VDRIILRPKQEQSAQWINMNLFKKLF
jgi:hypothetical protein